MRQTCAKTYHFRPLPSVTPKPIWRSPWKFAAPVFDGKYREQKQKETLIG